MTNVQEYDLLKTVSGLFDGTLERSASEALTQRLAEDVAAQAFYLEAVALEFELEWLCNVDLSKTILRTPTASPLVAADNQSSTDFAQNSVAKTPVSHSLIRSKLAFLARPALRYAALVAVCLYGSFFLIAWNLRPDKMPKVAAGSSDPVAVVRDATDVQWSKSISSKPTESPILSGEPLKIESGTIELELKAGTKLVVEGPADWSVDAENSVSLRTGKLTASVPKQAIGFTVNTPTARIVDLGTEFGVEVSDKDGRAEVEVFRGEVEIEHKQDPKSVSASVAAPPKRVRLRAGQTYTATENTVISIGKPNPNRFTRRIAASAQPSLDLADIVAGGDGLGRRRERGIDPITGEVVAFPEKDFSKFGYLRGDRGFHAAVGLPLVDGVFVPSSTGSETQLDSAGHKFQFLEVDGSVFGPVWAGGRIPTTYRSEESLAGISTVLGDDLDYAPESRGLISMSPNKGVTFDLAAIRSTHDGHRIKGFTSRVGCSANPRSAPGSSEHAADIWVFVDGIPIVEKRAVERYGQPIALIVPLTVEARFLSLVATDAGNGPSMDWVIFGIPRLELASEVSKSPN